MKNFFLLCLFVFYNHFLQAQLYLPSVLSDNMVIQQKSEVAIWGKAHPAKEVRVTTSWNNKTYRTTVSKDSTWLLKVQTPIASFLEHYISIVSDKETKKLKNILIGEVWLCSGQSNMEMKMKGYINQPVNTSMEDIAISSNDFLRCYTVDKVSSVKAFENTGGTWLAASPNTTGEFTATGYHFGRLLQRILNVPIGLVSCSWGGAAIEAWMSEDAFKTFPAYTLPKTESDNKAKNKTPTVLYNGMLKSIQGYGIRGAIWYQGETNRSNYMNYPALFQSMHSDWIEKWDIGTFPIYFCQIAPFKYPNVDKYNSAFMREAQLKIAESQPNTAMAVLVDVGEENCIHPANKKKAGERLAYIALGRTYGFDKQSYRSPQLLSVMPVAGKIIVKFKYAPDGLTAFGNELSDFEVAGEDHVFYPAKAKIILKGVELTSEKVSHPIAVRYGFKDYFKGSLFGVNGQPVSSFRSDNW